MATKADSKSTSPSKPNSTARRRKKPSSPIRPKRPARKVIEADEVVIRDRRGRKRIHLGCHGETDTAGIWISDNAENVCLCLLVTSKGDSVQVSLWTPEGQDSVRLAVQDEYERASIGVSHVDPKKRGTATSDIMLAMSGGNPSLRVSEKSGESHKFSGKVVLA